MYFLNALALFSGGLIPLLVGAKKLRLSRGPFFLGWLSWSCAASPRIVLLSVLWAVFPFLSKPDTVPYMVTVTSLELLEVLSAYLFLSRHSRLKDLDVSPRLVFALGFGVGEAFTLAIATFLPADITPSVSVFMTVVERISLAVIQFGWVALISKYAADRVTINLSLGVFFRVLSSIITMTVPLVLFFYDVSLELSLLYFEAVLAVYALVVLLASLFLCRRIARSGLPTPALNSRYLLAGVIAFLGVGLAILTAIPLLHLTSILSLVTRLLFFVIATMVLIELFGWATSEVALSEFALGAFIGILVENSFRLSFAKEALLTQLTIQSVMLHPALNFLAVLAGIALWKSARR